MTILLTKLWTVFRFHQFFTRVLPYQDRFQTLHCISLSPLVSLVCGSSQLFLLFHELETFRFYWPVIL